MKWFTLALLISTSAAWGNETDRLLGARTTTEQANLLALTVQSSGDPCNTPSRPFRMGIDRQGTAIWSVACSNGKSYAVSISSNASGSTKVLDCAALKAIVKVDCFKKI